MKYKDVYEDCKNLVSYGVVVADSEDFRRETYLDSFGCDLQVYLNRTSCRATGEMQESIRVYLGGRKVYGFDSERPNNEYMVDGHWRKLISELWHYELSIYLEESYAMNNTLLELCRREAMRNHETMKEYCELCSLLAKKKGRMKILPGGTRCYGFEEVVDDHRMRAYMTERTSSERTVPGDEIELAFGDKFVFTFHFNSSDVGGSFDNKGDYTPGEWERILKQLTAEL